MRLAVANDLRLGVSDDGVGIAKEHDAGVGLLSMRERAAELGGKFAVAPAPGADPGADRSSAGGGVMDTLRLLIAEDHPLFRKGMVSLLQAIKAVGRGEAIFSPQVAEKVLAYFASLQPKPPCRKPSRS